MTNQDSLVVLLYWLIGIVVFFALALSFVRFEQFIIDFKLELRFIKGEIARSMGDERKFWIRQKRRLWLSLLPFVNY